MEEILQEARNRTVTIGEYEQDSGVYMIENPDIPVALDVEDPVFLVDGKEADLSTEDEWMFELCWAARFGDEHVVSLAEN